jgi:hypothetical protein
MKVERFKNDSGEFRAFAIEERKLSRTGTAKILENLEGVEIIHYPHWTDFDVFCLFKFQGYELEAYEMYSDSGQYEISATEADLEQLEEIAKHFEASAPIRGGDIKHNLYVLLNSVIRGSIILGVGYIIWLAYERLSS